MKLLFENWRKYLTELAAKTVEELPENWFVKTIRFPGIIRVELLEKDDLGRLQRIPGREDPFSTIQAMHSDHQAYGDEYPGLDTYIIQKSSAPAGYGPLLYDVIMEMAGEKGLTPDQSGIVSDFAKAVWEKYTQREDIISIPFGENEENVLKTIFKKPTQEKIARLRKTEKLIEDSEEITEEPTFIEPEPDVSDEAITDIWDELDDIYENKSNLGSNDTNEVSKVVISDENGQILLLKRADKPHNWDLPGGHLEKGENYEEGASREAREETNLDISDLVHINDHENTKFFKCPAPKGDISLQPEEHTDFKWVNPSEIDKYKMKMPLKRAILAVFGSVKENFQQKVKKKHRKMKFKLTGKGKNRHNVGKKMQKPTYKRAKSAPPGAGGT